MNQNVTQWKLDHVLLNRGPHPRSSPTQARMLLSAINSTNIISTGPNRNPVRSCRDPISHWLMSYTISHPLPIKHIKIRWGKVSLTIFEGILFNQDGKYRTTTCCDCRGKRRLCGRISFPCCVVDGWQPAMVSADAARCEISVWQDDVTGSERLRSDYDS